jgi:hypothetical protein
VGALKEVETQSDMPDKPRLQLRLQVLRDYEWSSYRDYAGLRSPSSWLTLDRIRERIGSSLKDYRRELDQRITRDQLGLDSGKETCRRNSDGQPTSGRSVQALASAMDGWEPEKRNPRFCLDQLGRNHGCA